MAKRGRAAPTSSPRPGASARPRKPDSRRSAGEPGPAPPAPPRKTRSKAMQLAQEVAALKAALAQARAQVDELAARADSDPLLDIPNRRGFLRTLSRSIAYVKRYGVRAALVFIDLDGFKPINDRFGHAAGDAVLRAVAAALQAHVRASDIVARLGGDEFVVLLWNLREEDAAAKCEALERVIAGLAVPAGSERLRVAASAGMSMLYPLDTADEALARADRAMYARKRARAAE